MDREERNKKFEEYLHATPAERRKFDLSFLNEPSLHSNMDEELKKAARKYAIPSYMKDVDENYLDEYPYDKIAESAFLAGVKWMEDHTPLPEDTVLFNKGVEEGKRLAEEELSDLLTIAHLQGADQMKEQMMKEAVKWLVDDDYHEASEKGRFILGSVGLGYNGYYIPYLDLLKLPKED